jgi:hypothetical protein
MSICLREAKIDPVIQIGAMPMQPYSRTYQIIIEGQLDLEWEEWFFPLKISPLADGTTQLSGSLNDQAVLFGMLNKLYRLNLELVSLRKMPDSGYSHERESDER